MIIEAREHLVFENKSFRASYYISDNNIIETESAGYMDINSAVASQDHFMNVVVQSLKQKGIAPPYIIIIHLKKVYGADNKARKYLRTSVSELYEQNILSTGLIVSPSYFVRTMGMIWKALNPGFQYNFYKTKLEAYQHILNRENKAETVKLNDNVRETIQKASLVKFKQDQLTVIKKPSWQYEAEDGSIQVDFLLVDENILVIIPKGSPNEQQIKASTETVKDIFQENGGKKLIIILDLKEMKFPSLKAKKAAISLNDQLEGKWEHRFFVVTPHSKTIFKLFKIAHPKFVKNTIAEDTFEKALSQSLSINKRKKWFNKLNNGKGVEQVHDLYKYTKEELIAKISDMYANQIQKTNILFEVFSRITWDDSFKPEFLSIDENDPFYHLFNAVNVLQDDVYEMVKELKDLNQNLENKVQQRTQELNQKNQELTVLNKELDQFVYVITHDLKAPLSSIKGLLQLIKIEPDTAMREKYFGLMTQSIEKQEKFIEEILQISHNSQHDIQPGPVDLEQMIHQSFEELSGLDNADLIRNKIIVHKKQTFYSDQRRLKIIFKNIISNAIKYSLPEQRKAEIRINIHFDEQNVILKFKDNGMGIKEEHLEKLFSMFYRATSQRHGSGLGLYIVKETVEKLNGAIKLWSEYGKGTTIELTLPNLRPDKKLASGNKK